jgi:hypothetical protein
VPELPGKAQVENRGPQLSTNTKYQGVEQGTLLTKKQLQQKKRKLKKNFN